MREQDLLQHVYAANAALPAGVTVPPGDDMGAVRVGEQVVLVTVDQVAAGVHVDLAAATLEQVGRKAITRNLSDVAAMAAKPVGAVAAVCLPRGFGDERARRLFDAMRTAAEAFACPLIGGDISMWDQPMILTVTVFAEPAGIEPVLRRGAQAGDAVYVTGALGGSGETVAGYTHHLDFTPRINVARKLAGDPATRPHCMIDLSDGLARDLGHLCRAADLGAQIDADRLPLSDGAKQAAQRSGQPAWRHAVGDGEDYELLFTAPPGRVPDAIEGVPITAIGTMQPAPLHGPALRLRLGDGELIDLAGLGWEHHG